MAKARKRKAPRRLKPRPDPAPTDAEIERVLAHLANMDPREGKCPRCGSTNVSAGGLSGGPRTAHCEKCGHEWHAGYYAPLVLPAGDGGSPPGDPAAAAGANFLAGKFDPIDLGPTLEKARQDLADERAAHKSLLEKTRADAGVLQAIWHPGACLGAATHLDVATVAVQGPAGAQVFTVLGPQELCNEIRRLQGAAESAGAMAKRCADLEKAIADRVVENSNTGARAPIDG